MPSPSPSTAVSRPDLAATMEEFPLEASRQGFVGLRLMPVLEVAEQSADIGIIPVEELLADHDTARASTGHYNRSKFNFGEFHYATKEHGHEEPVDDRLKRIYRRYFDAETVAARRARDNVLRGHEKRVCAKLTNTGTFTNVARDTAAWSASGSKPIDDVRARLIAVRNACGLVPNTVAMDYEAFLVLKDNPQIIDRLKYAGIDDPKNLTAAALAILFNVEQVVVAGGQRNAGKLNEAGGFTLNSLWPKNTVGVGYVAREMDVQEPSVGRTFHWSEDGSDIGAVIETYRDESTRSDIVRARFEVDEKVHYPICWQLITGVLT